MIEWVEELRAGFTEEFGTGPKIVTLATVEGSRREPRARARSVVCRRLLDHGILLIASDARSNKNWQLRQNHLAEVCTWLPKLGRQFRLSCWGVVIDHKEATPDEKRVPELLATPLLRETVWGEMSEAARALFFWPPPGEPLVANSAAFPEAVRTGLPPDNFEVLGLMPEEVDLLDLSAHPHRRRRWRREAGQWRAEVVNP